MRWLSAVPATTRRRFLGALAECDGEVEAMVFQMVSIVENPQATASDRDRALATIADVLRLNEDNDDAASRVSEAATFASQRRDVQNMNCQEAVFADRLRELMAVKCVTQEELSDRVGCSQPAISQMLNRKSRPQKKSILKLADALKVQPQELWPDMEVADMLDAVAGFEQVDHLMTEAEAKALGDPAGRNSPKIPARPLPTRQF